VLKGFFLNVTNLEKAICKELKEDIWSSGSKSELGRAII